MYDSKFAIVVSTADLLSKLEKHKARFQKTYKALMKHYEKETKKYLDEYAKHTEKVLAGTVNKKKDRQPYAPNIPEDNTETYNSFIKMVESHRELMIKLDQTAYKTLWLDKWDFIRGHVMALWAAASDSNTTSTTSTTSGSMSDLAAEYNDVKF